MGARRPLIALAALLVAGCSSGSRAPSTDGAAHGADASTQVADGGVVDGAPVACTPTAVETLACGACGSGQATRTCGASGTWDAPTDCAGADPFPFSPTTLAPVCPPYTRPAVFFSPHQDDEVLSMGGAILQHRAAGRDVFVELLTRGQASGARALLGNGGTDDWHAGSHVYALSEADFSAARDREFLASAAQLGVNGVVMNGLTDGALGATETAARVGWWTGGGHTGLSLKTTTATSFDHTVAHDALVASGFADVRFYGTSAEPYTRADDITDVCATKRLALDVYKLWDPPNGRYAVGYHSVRGLFDAYAADCREFVTVP